MKKENLEKITKSGFKYIKRDYFNPKLEIYERPSGEIIYNPETDEIVIQTGYTKLESENEKTRIENNFKAID